MAVVRVNISVSEELRKELNSQHFNFSNVCEAALWRRIKGVTEAMEIERLTAENLILRKKLKMIAELSRRDE